jgi:hypothetical protein
VSYEGSAVPARAAGQTFSPAEAAALNQTLENMKATVLQMQSRLNGAQQNSEGQVQSVPVGIISVQDASSLKNVLASLSVVLSELQSSSMMNGNVITENQKTAMRSVLGGISANLLSMKDTLAGISPHNPPASAMAENSGTNTQASPGKATASAPTVAQAPNQPAPENVVSASVPPVSENADQQLAQVSLATGWNKWGWPIAIGIVVIFIALMWFRRTKKTQPVVAKSYQNPKKEAVAQPSTGTNVKPNFPEERQPLQEPESKIVMPPFSSVTIGTPTQPPIPQKFQEQKKPTGY